MKNKFIKKKTKKNIIKKVIPDIKKCIICDNINSIYKFKCCFNHYCSLNCYKKHENCLSIINKKNEIIKNDINNKNEILKRSESDTEDICINIDMSKIEYNENIRKYIINKNLQNIIRYIDSSKNRYEELIKRLETDFEFVEFIDQIADCIGFSTE
eukprot:GHVL01041700.1.p1 GENE.GHVL01041700.1~~GHVL01041700.1.p1  ORF type:complete len:156 (+),score=52.12 GHVL01041700.1:56-523(+)